MPNRALPRGGCLRSWARVAARRTYRTAETVHLFAHGACTGSFLNLERLLAKWRCTRGAIGAKAKVATPPPTRLLAMGPMIATAPRAVDPATGC